MKKKHFLIFVLIIAFSFVLTGCVPGDGKNTIDNPAGFFTGVWHGWVAPISLIIKIFNKNISIFETNNTGWAYEFGYYIAIISGFGGLSLVRKKKKED